MEQQELSSAAGEDAKCTGTLEDTDPAVTLLGLYPKELKTYVHPKTCTPMFIAALLIIAQT